LGPAEMNNNCGEITHMGMNVTGYAALQNKMATHIANQLT
jgi:hypothetical protein